MRHKSGTKSTSKSTSKSTTKSTTKSKTKSINENEPIKIVSNILNINFKKGESITARVETLSSSQLAQLDGNYAIVDKADGLRTVLYIDKHGNVYSMNQPYINFLPIEMKCNNTFLYNSLLDSEYVSSLKTYFCFDIMIFNGKDVRSEPFEDRHKLLIKFDNKDVKWTSEHNKQLKVKKYEINYTNFYKSCRKVYYRKYPYYLDGIIFTPLKGDYQSSSLKWKPLNDLTIDLIARIRRSYKENNKTYLIVDLFTVMPRGQIYKEKLRFPKNYEEYFPYIDKTFYVVPFPFMPEYDNKYSYAVLEVIEKKKEDNSISYTGNESIEGDLSPIYYYKYIESNDDEDKHRGSFVDDNTQSVSIKQKKKVKWIPIMDNTVIEFNYDVSSSEKNPAKKWIPYRFRRDGTIQYWNDLYHNALDNKKLIGGPNSAIRANRIWEMYFNPITKDMIFGLTSLPKLYYVQNNIDRQNTLSMVFFHSFVKKSLYDKYFYYKNNTETLLELSAGDGSDCSNIIVQKPKYVLMVDIVETSLQRAAINFKRFQNKHRLFNTKFDTLALDLREDNIKKIAPYPKKIGFQKFDVVSIQFSFHYMMQSEQSFNNLFDVIKTYIKPGGFYFMSCFDGATVYKMLKEQREKVITVENEPSKILFKIEKMYPDNIPLENLDMFGMPINVFIYSIGSHIEYLVDFKKVVKYFKNNGFDLVDTKMFETMENTWYKSQTEKPMKLTEPEKAFSFLNRYAVFQRHS